MFYKNLFCTTGVRLNNYWSDNNTVYCRVSCWEVISLLMRRIRSCSRALCAWTWIRSTHTRTGRYGERWSTLISKNLCVLYRPRSSMSVEKAARISG